MNQPTHAWLAVEAFKTVQRCAKAHPTDKRKLDRLVTLLDQHLQEVVVAAWLPDSLIKDMAVGHIFKNSRHSDLKEKRFIVSREDLRKNLASAAFQRGQFLDTVPADWWTVAYRVKDKDGGHLPTRVASLCQNARDMLKMGDAELYRLCDVTPPAAHASIAPDLLYTSRDVAVMMWMATGVRHPGRSWRKAGRFSVGCLESQGLPTSALAAVPATVRTQARRAAWGR